VFTRSANRRRGFIAQKIKPNYFGLFWISCTFAVHLYISVDGSNIEPVENFIYLDSLQSSDGHCTQNLKSRIGLASSVMASLNRVWKDQRLTLTTKLRVYQAMVLSVLIYTYSRHVDSSCSRHESIRGFPYEMPATDTRYSQVRFRQQHRHSNSKIHLVA